MKLKKKVVIPLFIVLLLATTWMALFKPRLLPKPIQRHLFADWMIQEERRTDPAVGHLGGIPVSIPRPYAHFLEYDGDPGFTEPRKGPRPERTFESGIRSFGFEVHYPDMEVASAKNLDKQKSESIYTTTWLTVGVSSNSFYGGKDFPLGSVLAMKFKKYKYERSDEKNYELETYIPTNVDENKRQNGGGAADMFDYNIHYHKDATGRVDAYITCSNMKHEAATCQQKFNLFPHMAADVSVTYRRGLLKDWREIQSSVSNVIFGFKATKTQDQHN
ncbi:hypothetical protein G7939_00570 [Ralstonia solanacearum]|uniref:hypothetical protein n=1 Tax=Ralstonia pseudosolanacearum TaxID=1310165 RepID=UPI000B606C9D|nr:hypothetical protein [Ralstonia pseudosolanacearum]QIK22039.1 hypothetical protein G7939_00570 [Ralstonia solanacearum]ASL73310.1 hypothetical protein BC350_06440 [Ralstonia pseudosolanacearum]MCK4119638.1 hypothetical protein [Ralstonia pseudosolanacearum]QIK29926.1 hypothetical protein G7947_17255 [Ralstonia solanacearum]QIK34831.1 hypothetical protein G7969_17255 [Ralstonia solanacearum]